MSAKAVIRRRGVTVLYNWTVERVLLTASVWQEPEGFVSLCPELNVASCGADIEEALSMLKEAVELYLENAAELGILDDVRAALESPVHLSSALEVAVP